jgi:hypothetical protein
MRSRIAPIAAAVTALIVSACGGIPRTDMESLNRRDLLKRGEDLLDVRLMVERVSVVAEADGGREAVSTWTHNGEPQAMTVTSQRVVSDVTAAARKQLGENIGFKLVSSASAAHFVMVIEIVGIDLVTNDDARGAWAELRFTVSDVRKDNAIVAQANVTSGAGFDGSRAAMFGDTLSYNPTAPDPRTTAAQQAVLDFVADYAHLFVE